LIDLKLKNFLEEGFEGGNYGTEGMGEAAFGEVFG